MMTYHESYGHLPMRLLRLYKSVNASPADHVQILAAFGAEWGQDISVDLWETIFTFVQSHTVNGILRLPLYL